MGKKPTDGRTDGPTDLQKSWHSSKNERKTICLSVLFCLSFCLSDNRSVSLSVSFSLSLSVVNQSLFPLAFFRRYGSHQKLETIVSIGQFRPEKDHALQIASFAALLSRLPEERRKLVKLILIGGCRHADDVKRVEDLQVKEDADTQTTSNASKIYR